MGSPAGFLNFQGHNALNDGHQYTSMNFSLNLNDSLGFSNKLGDFAYGDLNSCDFKTDAPEIHNFTVILLLFSLLKTANAIHANKHVQPMEDFRIPNQEYWRASIIPWLEEYTCSCSQ